MVWYRTGQYNAAGVHTVWVPGRPGGSNLYGDTKYCWVLSMELVSCQPPGT